MTSTNKASQPRWWNKWRQNGSIGTMQDAGRRYINCSNLSELMEKFLQAKKVDVTKHALFNDIRWNERIGQVVATQYWCPEGHCIMLKFNIIESKNNGLKIKGMIYEVIFTNSKDNDFVLDGFMKGVIIDMSFDRTYADGTMQKSNIESIHN